MKFFSIGLQTFTIRIFILLLTYITIGCSTFTTIHEPGKRQPRIYSGVRHDISQLQEEKLGSGFFDMTDIYKTYYTIDFPFSLIFDTLLLPISGTLAFKDYMKSQIFITAIDLSPDDRSVALGDRNGKVSILTNYGTLQHEFHNHSDSISGLHWSNDGRYLLSASLDGTLNIISTTDYKTISVIKQDSEILSFELHQNGQGLGVASGTSLHLYKFTDIIEGKTIKPYYIIKNAYNKEIRKIQFSNDGSLVAVSGFGTKIIVWDLLDKEIFSTINSTNPINSFCFLPGKKQLVDSNAQIWNWEEEILIRKVGKEQFTLRTIDAINCHPDGKKFVLASSNQVYFMTSDDLTYYSNQPLGKNSFVDAVHFFHRSDLVIAVSSEGNNTITEK